MLVSTLVGCLEVTLAVVVVLLYVRTQPPPDAPADRSALAAGLFSFGMLVAVIAFLLSLVFVLPTVALTDLLERRIRGRDAWWGVPPVAATLVTPPIAVFAAHNPLGSQPLLVFWAQATAALSLGGLLARLRQPGLVRRVAVWGTAAVAGTGALGALALTVGVLPSYTPPLIRPAMLAGNWIDHTSGTLVFASDGRVTASGVGEHRPGDDPGNPSRHCTGSGTWSYEPGRDVRSQTVRVQVPGCSWPPWSVGGTDGQPWIYQHVGRPGSGQRYHLRKASDGR
ncbi:hypothetical protein [Streptomyces sp. NPDC091268]|uniref:hypothetical protein n=1 Tax=Streptomyces sp. NPDC091268 TaxID=3365979 RepID=UPI00381640AE